MSNAVGATSTQRLSYRERLERFYRRYDPSRTHHIDSLLVKFEGHEAEMFDALVKKYGPEPQSTGPISVKPCRERLKLRIYNFYRFYNPEKLGMVDDLADGYWEDGEENLFKSLIERYGPEPMVTSDGNVRRAPTRHRGLAMTDEQRRASVGTGGTTSPKNTSAETAQSAPSVKERDDGAADDDDDLDDLILGHNSDEDILGDEGTHTKVSANRESLL